MFHGAVTRAFRFPWRSAVSARVRLSLEALFPSPFVQLFLAQVRDEAEPRWPHVALSLTQKNRVAFAQSITFQPPGARPNLFRVLSLSLLSSGLLHATLLAPAQAPAQAPLLQFSVSCDILPQR